MSGSEPWRNPRPAPPLDELGSRLPTKSMIPLWLRAWWPAILWGIVISLLSTDTFSAAHTGSILWAVLHWIYPAITDDQFETIHFVIRKSAHLTEYFIFYLLLFRGMRGDRKGWYWTWAFGAWFLAAAYSALDEIHQSFVVSRTASPIDSMIDSTGALFALIIVYLYYHFFRRTRPA